MLTDTGYKYITEAANMPEAYRYLRVRLQMEQQRFLSFAMTAGLLSSESRLYTTLQVNQQLLKGVLIEINTLFQKFEMANGKYVATTHWNEHHSIWEAEPQTNLMDMICRTGDSISRSSAGGTYAVSKESPSRPRSFTTIRGRAVNKVKKLRTVLVEPKRFVWASSDRGTFEELIKKLAELNSFLITLLDSASAADLERTMDSSYLEIMQVRDDIASLKNLVQALTPHKPNAEGGWVKPFSASSANGECHRGSMQMQNPLDQARREYLKKLTSIKIQCITVDQPEKAATPSLTNGLDRDMFDFPQGPLNLHCAFGPQHESSRQVRGPSRDLQYWNGHHIWVEWLTFSPYEQKRKKARDQAKARSLLLAELLRQELPTEFRSPPCLGYVKAIEQEDDTKFGLVFKVPLEAESIVPPRLSTLRQLLGTQPKPSLSSRISLCSVLAEGIHSFHAVDWLHKGLRSENILIFGADPVRNQEQLVQPYITGFELSRPNDEPEMTEKAAFDPLAELYRHPFAQAGENTGSYRKAYDMYSFGIILVEIALWKRIDVVLRFDNLTTMKLREFRAVRELLLGESLDYAQDSIVPDTPTLSTQSPCLQRVSNKCGDSFRDMVKICLAADEVEQPAYGGESYSSRSQRLRTMFDEQVLGRLRAIEEALRGVP